VAERTVLDAVLVAVTLADEVEDNLHLLRKSQGLYLDDLRLALFRTALGRHTDAEQDLGMGEVEEKETRTQRATLQFKSSLRKKKENILEMSLFFKEMHCFFQ